MSGSSSFVRMRSLRIPQNLLKLSSRTKPTNPPLPQLGPSNITLFLTNLKLLDLDLRDDWPEISVLTFSTKNSQQNQKKRVQCVEWALYQLFLLWDPEEACSKLQPFFPPLEPLQSLNLRNALYRCLDQVKKNGNLGQGIVLRKTMFDECKGEKLEEILAVFSNIVLKKSLANSTRGQKSLALQLAFEDLSYNGEINSLLSLIIAHKASLRNHLEKKKNLRERYHEFNNLLNSLDYHIDLQDKKRKVVADKEMISANISEKRCQELHNRALESLSGNSQGLRDIFTGETSEDSVFVLSTSFGDLWNHIEQGTLENLETRESRGKICLLEELNTKLQNQDDRLAKWEDFGSKIKKIRTSLSIEKSHSIPIRCNGIDLGLTKHLDFKIGSSVSIETQHRPQSLDEYCQLLDDMKLKLDEVGRPHILTHEMHEAEASVNFENDSYSFNDVQSCSGFQNTPKIIPFKANRINHRQNEGPELDRESLEQNCRHSDLHELEHEYVVQNNGHSERCEFGSESSDQELETLQPKHMNLPTNSRNILDESNHIHPNQCESHPVKSRKNSNSESELANLILNSMSASSPSPEKPKPSLSLAERARISMASTRLKYFSTLENTIDASNSFKQPSKHRDTMTSNIPKPVIELDHHADLSQRTRNSMSGRESALKLAHLGRLRSQKEEKRKMRESLNLHKIEEKLSLDKNKIEMIEGDPDYESVFMSRPKINTSPGMSPEQAFPDLGDSL